MCFYWSRQSLGCIASISNMLGGIWHNGKCENPAAPQVGRKLNNGRKCHPEKGGGQKKAEIHKLCSRICGGRDKSKLLPQQSRILHERILGHANAAVTGRCQTENSKRNAIAVHLCGDQARSSSHKGAITKRCRFCYVSFKFRYCSIALLHFLDA